MSSASSVARPSASPLLSSRDLWGAVAQTAAEARRVGATSSIPTRPPAVLLEQLPGALTGDGGNRTLGVLLAVAENLAQKPGPPGKDRKKDDASSGEGSTEGGSSGKGEPDSSAPRPKPPSSPLPSPPPSPPSSPRLLALFDPFFRPEPALVVGALSPSHELLLNKFNVVDGHVLVVTRLFSRQESPLSRADLEATWKVLQACHGDGGVERGAASSSPRSALAFFNCGPASGASQPHKHVQVVPLPLEGGGWPPRRGEKAGKGTCAAANPAPEAPGGTPGSVRRAESSPSPLDLSSSSSAVPPGNPSAPVLPAEAPIEAVLRRAVAHAAAVDGAEPGTAVPVRELPYVAWAASVPSGLGDGPAAAARLHGIVQSLMKRAGLPTDEPPCGPAPLGALPDGTPVPSPPASFRSYNLLLTPRFALVVPRSKERSGAVAVNSVAYAGSLFARSEAVADEIRRRGALTILAELGVPWGEASI